MELNLHRQPIAACELLLDTAAEMPIECDVLLPDYCPDIARVLCCQICTVATDCAVQNNVFSVEGTSTVKICYVGEVGGVKKAEYKLPFSKSFELKNKPLCPVWSVAAQQGHINCRAISKRRIDVRAAAMLKVKLFDTAKRPTIDSAEGMGVQLRSCEESAMDLTGQIQRRFSVAEILSPMPGKAAPIEIVRVNCLPVVQDTRVMASRVLIKGELLVHLLYKTDPDTGELETADYTLPLSQILEGESIGDDTQCETQLECSAVDCAPEELGEEGELRLEAQFCANIIMFKPIVLTGATDSYSTLYPTHNTLAKMRVPKLCTAVSERSSVRAQAQATDKITAITDTWAEIYEQSARSEGGTMTVNVKVKFTSMISTEETPTDSFTHICDAEISLATKNAQCELMGNVSVLAATATLSAGQINFGCELLLNAMLVQFETKDFLTELAVDEENPRKIDPLVGLMVYYAQRGEHIWDISKRFGSLPSQIMADNQLTSEILQADMPLMIPTV